MSADGAAIIAAAIQAAIHAKAPRRTVAAVAAAVASAFARPVAARATPAAGGSKSDGLQCAAERDEEQHLSTPEGLLEALRSARRAQRRRKKERRKAAKLAVPPDVQMKRHVSEQADGRAGAGGGTKRPAPFGLQVGSAQLTGNAMQRSGSMHSAGAASLASLASDQSYVSLPVTKVTSLCSSAIATQSVTPSGGTLPPAASVCRSSDRVRSPRRGAGRP